MRLSTKGFMRFDAREVRQHAESIMPGELRGATYFMLHFIDEGLMVPELSPVVYIGRELLTDDAGVLYFQDAGSYFAGLRFPKCADEDAEVYAQGEDEINHIFAFERALDALLACSLRRSPPK